MSAFSLLSSSVYQQPVIHCSVRACLCVGLCVSVYGAAWCPAPKCVVSLPCRVGGCRETPCVCAFHHCHPNSCPPTLLISLSFFHTNPQLLTLETLNFLYFLTQTQHNSEAIQYSLGVAIRQLESFPTETWYCRTFVSPKYVRSIICSCLK